MLIFLRLALLGVGLALVYFLHGWGLFIYFVIFVLTCRHLAERLGVTQYSFPVTTLGRGGDPYIWATVALLGMTIIFILLPSSSYSFAIPFFEQWEQKSLVGFSPKCSNRPYSVGVEPFDCYTLYHSIGFMLLLAVGVTILCFDDLILTSRTRVKIGTYYLRYVVFITLFLVLFPWSIPVSIASLASLNVLSYGMVLMSIFLQMVLVFLWCRITV